MPEILSHKSVYIINTVNKLMAVYIGKTEVITIIHMKRDINCLISLLYINHIPL